MTVIDMGLPQRLEGAFYDYYLLIPVIAFGNRGICLVCFSSPIFTSFLCFLIVNNIIICSEIYFSLGLCCRETGQLTSIGWCLYDTGGC